MLLSALVGCGSTGGSTATTAAATASTPAPRLAECVELEAAVGALAAEARGFLDGAASGDEVRAALDAVGAALEDAKAVVGEQARARFDDAERESQRARAALDAQPADLGELQTALPQAAAALRDAISICAP